MGYGQPRPNRTSVAEVPAMRWQMPVETIRTLPNQGNRGEDRAMRQMEISKYLRAAQRGMDQLPAAKSAQPASDRVSTPGSLRPPTGDSVIAQSGAAAEK